MYVDHKQVKGPRIGAAIIDYILISIVLGIVSLIVTFSSYDFGGRYVSESEIYKSIYDSMIITQSISLSFYFLYFTIFPYITKGRTLGKLMTGVRVVSNDYTKASFLQLLIRNAYFFIGLFETVVLYTAYKTAFQNDIASFQIFSTIIGTISWILYLIILIMIIATSNGVGLHDIIARTVIVKKDFDIDNVNNVNALERRDMTWATFEEDNQTDVEILNNDENDDDEIELLNE